MAAEGADAHDHRPARADLHDALGWIALGIAIVVGSLMMDRLESQNINPYTVPGLLPGLLGSAMVLLGTVLAVRSWRRGASTEPRPQATEATRSQRKRVAVVLLLCVGYAAGLVGHGLPYWVASSLFVATTILVLQRLSPEPEQRRITTRNWVQAVTVGLGAAITVQLVFQELFLVRLP